MKRVCVCGVAFLPYSGAGQRAATDGPMAASDTCLFVLLNQNAKRWGSSHPDVTDVNPQPNILYLFMTFSLLFMLELLPADNGLLKNFYFIYFNLKSHA